MAGPARADPAVPTELVKAGGESLVRHTGNYEPLQLAWSLNDRVADVLAVFPHPQAASDVYLATQAGLMKSTDGGRSFAALPNGGAEKIGQVNMVTFRPDAPDRVIIATNDHGLFQSNDGGKTIAPLASKATGLAGDAVVDVKLAGDDELLRTIVALHGGDAPGLSRSTDGGKTWEVLFPDQHVFNVFWPRRGEKQLLLEGSPKDDVDRRALYFLASIQEPWQKLVGDVLITGAASPTLERDGTIFLATMGQGFIRVARDGGVVTSHAPGDEADWASFGVTFGATADSEVYYAYHPKKRGLCFFNVHQLKGTGPVRANNPEAPPPKLEGPPFRTLSEGLFTGDLVLEGAHVRANANGNAFYAVVNRVLYQSAIVPTGLGVIDARVAPSTIFVEPDKIRVASDALLADINAFNGSHRTLAGVQELRAKLAEHRKALDVRRFVVSATVRSAATDPTESVTVDLSRVGKSPLTPLYDDGNHQDGGAGDGVYAASFDLDFAGLKRHNDDWRGKYPGPIALTVSAASRSRSLAGAVGTLSLFLRRDSVPFAPDATPVKVVGAVTGSRTRVDGKTRKGLPVISIKAPGEWAASINNWRDTVELANDYVLSFYIKSSQPTPDGISIQLRDGPKYSIPNTTPKLDLMAGAFLPGKSLSPAEQRVIVPVSRLIENAGDFQPSITAGMILSGTASRPVDLTLRDIQLIPAATVEAGAPEEKQ